MNNKTALAPRNKIEINGRLNYCESMHAWGNIRLKKELINEFPQLRERRSKFSFKVGYHRSLQELEKEIKSIKSKKWAPLPLLVWLYKEG